MIVNKNEVLNKVKLKLKVNRRQHDESKIQVPSVPVVKSYNNMGGVDQNNQLRRY